MSREKFFKLSVNIEYSGYNSTVELSSNTIYFTEHNCDELILSERVDCLDFIRTMKKKQLRMVTMELWDCDGSTDRKSIDSYRIITHLGGYKVAKLNLINRTYDFDSSELIEDKTLKQLFVKYFDFLNKLGLSCCVDHINLN